MSMVNKRGRPTARQRDSISEAVVRVREAFGDTQQQFAQRLDVSITTIARYETDRPPTGTALHKFAELARSIGQSQVAEVFEQALAAEENGNERDSGLRRAVLLALIENNGPEWLQHELSELIAKAQKGHRLSYPEIFDRDRKPDETMRLAYLKDLLADIKRAWPTSKKGKKK